MLKIIENEVGGLIEQENSVVYRVVHSTVVTPKACHADELRAWLKDVATYNEDDKTWSVNFGGVIWEEFGVTFERFAECVQAWLESLGVKIEERKSFEGVA